MCAGNEIDAGERNNYHTLRMCVHIRVLLEIKEVPGTSLCYATTIFLGSVFGKEEEEKEEKEKEEEENEEVEEEEEDLGGGREGGGGEGGGGGEVLNDSVLNIQNSSWLKEKKLR